MDKNKQDTAQLERIMIYATLTDQKRKVEYEYQQTCYIEGTTMHTYEEDLATLEFLSKFGQGGQVSFKEVITDCSIEEGAILIRLTKQDSLISEKTIEEVALSEVKEWSNELISDNNISSYEVETNIVLSDERVIEKMNLGFRFN